MRRTIGVTLLVLAVAWPAVAQRITASIRGTVTDTTGAVVPGATVTVNNEGTGFSRSTVTNASGSYSFAELPVGTYTVDVSLSGFKSVVRKGIVLNVADVPVEDAPLAGGLNETVTVQVPSVGVQTVGGEVAGLVTGEQGALSVHDFGGHVWRTDHQEQAPVLRVGGMEPREARRDAHVVRADGGRACG